MATRFYFPATTVADVNPAPGAWNYITEAVFRYLAKTKGVSAITLGTQVGPWTATAGQKALDRVYVSDPLSPQTISGTAKMQLMTREYATTDNVDQLILLIKVVSGNGDTVRGTLLALGNYASTAEFVNNATHRNKKGADGDALSSVVCQEHDRIVVEIGYCNSTAGTTPEASAKWGENAADLPENETQTTDGAGWIEFSGDIAFSTDPNLDKQVAASSDDCYRRVTTTYWSLTDTFVYSGDSSATYYDYSGGMRFLGIDIAQGAIIDLAYLSIRAVAITGTIPTTYIEGEDVDDAATFSEAANYDGRTRTTASVVWTPAAWVLDTWYNSSEIKTVIKEIVDRPGWVSGNDLVLFWRDAPGYVKDERIKGYSWDQTGNISGPKLHIEYTAGGASYSLVVDAGSYTVAGTAVSLPIDRVMGAGAGSYAVAGTAAGLNRGLVIAASGGSYAVSGNAVSLPLDRVISADSGTYVVTGTAASLIKDILIAAATGIYTLTGMPVDLPRDRVMEALAGSYAITGQAVSFPIVRVITASGGSYTITGMAASLLLDLVMQALGGSYAVAGQTIGLTRAIVMTAEAGSYLLSGTEVGLGEEAGDGRGGMAVVWIWRV